MLDLISMIYFSPFIDICESDFKGIKIHFYSLGSFINDVTLFFTPSPPTVDHFSHEII